MIMPFLSAIKKLKKSLDSYQPLIEIKVLRENLLHNLRQFQKTYPKFQFTPVLKSNAYGHGLVQVARILDGEGLPFFMVDSFYEALVLRRAGIKTKILKPNDVIVFQNDWGDNYV